MEPTRDYWDSGLVITADQVGRLDQNSISEIIGQRLVFLGDDLPDYRLDGYLISKYYLLTGLMSARRQDCKNEMCGCFPVDLCVS